MLSSLDKQEKENMTREVAALVTPKRCPLKKIQENQTYSSSLGTVKRRASSVTSQILHKSRRKPKRLSVPFHVFSKVLESDTICVRSPLRTLTNEQSTVFEPAEFGSPVNEENVKCYTPMSKAAKQGLSPSECKSVDRYVCDEKKDLEKLIQGVASAILREMKTKEDVGKNSTQQKLEEYEKTIIIMNKERMLLEKQLSDWTKPKEENKSTNHQTKRTKTNQTVVGSVEHRSKDLLIKQLEKDLERKKNELLRTKDELKHTQEHLLEIPTLKSELHKNKQEIKGISKSLHCCQEENMRLKKEIDKCKTLLTDKDKLLKEYRESSNKKLDELKVQLKEQTALTGSARKELEKGQKNLWSMRSKLDQRSSEVKKLQEQIKSQEKELETYNIYCLTITKVVEKLEGDISLVELKKCALIKYQNSLEEQIKDLSDKCYNTENQLEQKTKTIQEQNDQLQELRANEDVLKSENQKIAESLARLQSELDISRLEILRQQGVINNKEKELHQAKIELYQYDEHIELLEAHEKEVNEFVEQERTNLVNTAKDLEKQLLSTKDELCQLNTTFKEKSLKCEEFVVEVEHSKNQLHEKQEELNATQTQAHWMLLHHQMEITQAEEALKEAWDIVDEMLEKFTQDAEINWKEKIQKVGLQEAPSNETVDEENDSESSHQTLSSSSLVQRVLEATANRKNQSVSCKEDTVEDVQATGLLEPPKAKRELHYDQVESESDIMKEDEPQSLAEQVYELKQALERLAEVGSGKTANMEAQMTIKRLEEERYLKGLKFESSLKDIELKLDTSRSVEVQLRREIEQNCVQRSQLKASLEESQHNFQLAMAKIDSLSQQCSEQIETETRLQLLTVDSKSMAEDIEKLEKEKEYLSVELKEAFDKLDQLTRDNSITDAEQMIGKLLDEKFTLERRLKQLKEKSHNYRLEMQDYVDEYRTKADSKIRILERNLEKAEIEICRLDNLIESIRLALHQNRERTEDAPDLDKLLQFIEGKDC